jgi:hypothetical protein
MSTNLCCFKLDGGVGCASPGFGKVATSQSGIDSVKLYFEFELQILF